MKKLLITLLVLLLSGAQIVSADSKKELHVGMILPFSGDAASVGEAFKNGFDLGLEKLPQEVRDSIVVHYEDDALNPSKAISAFKKLRSSSQIEVAVNLSSGTGNALAPVAERAEVPLIAIASDPRIVKGRKYVVNFWVTPKTEVTLLHKEMKKKGYKKIARISTIQEGVLAVRDEMDAQNDGSYKVVLDEEYPTEIRDFKPFLTRLRQHKEVDAILPILMTGQLGVFARQARNFGFKQPFFGAEIFEDANEVKLSNGALVGSWYVNADEPEGSFIEDYRKRFPKASTYSASNGHDVALLLGKSLEKGHSAESVNQFLHSVKDFSGVLGTYSAAGDNTFTLPAVLKKVTEGGFERIGK